MLDSPRLLKSKARRVVRLSLLSLESREVPANTISVTSGASAGISISAPVAGVVTVNTTAASAQLSLTDIRNSLAAVGVNEVIVSTSVAAGGTNGSQAGSINWASTAGALNLDGVGTGKTLTFRPDSTGSVPSFNLTTVAAFTPFVDSNLSTQESVDLQVDTSAGSGAIQFQYVTGPITIGSASNLPLINSVRLTSAAGGVSIANATILTNFFSFGDVFVQSTGGPVTANVDVSAANITIAGSTIALRGELSGTAAVLVQGAVTLSPFSNLLESPTSVTVNGAIAGGGSNLSINAGSTIVLNGNASGLAALNFNSGLLTLGGANSITAISLSLSNGATLAGTGPISAAVTVNPFSTLTYTGSITGSLSVIRGRVSPAGDSTVGTLSVAGPLDLDDQSVVFMNLGVTSDSINVTGNVDLTTGGGNENTITGIGSLPTAAATTLLTYGGTLTGTFGNLLPLVPAVLGTEAVTANYGAGINSALSVVRVAGVKAIAGTDFDGTPFTIKVTGPGEVVLVTDASFFKTIVTRSTTAKSKLQVATKFKFGSSSDIELLGLNVNGTIASITAKKVNIGTNGIHVTGTVKSISVLDVFGIPRLASAPIIIGGTNLDRTSIQARDIRFAIVTSGGQIKLLKTRGDLVSSLNAAAFGSVLVGDEFAGDLKTPGSVKSFAVKSTLTDGGGSWQVGGSIGRLTAGQIAEFQLTANFIGSITVSGNRKLLLAATINNSTFTATGNTGILKGSFGVRKVNVLGTVSDTTFDVQEGNVASFAVGRFINSNLLLDYSAGVAFNTSGSFGANNFKLGTFSTKATSFIDPSGTKVFSFEESQVAASTIGSAKIVSLNADSPSNTAFGIKFLNSVKSVKILKESSNPAILPKVNLTSNTGGAALADDFFFIDG